MTSASSTIELRIWRYVLAHGPVSVSEVSIGLGTDHEQVRNCMRRLRAKRRLQRVGNNNSSKYVVSAAIPDTPPVKPTGTRRPNPKPRTTLEQCWGWFPVARDVAEVDD